MNRILPLFTAGLAFGPDWSVYGGHAGGARYSPLKEINRSNVAKLKTAGNATRSCFARLEATRVMNQGSKSFRTGRGIETEGLVVLRRQ